jgi:hypothetical protein
MSSTYSETAVKEAVKALRTDLLAPGGPRISTMRNYRFAILPYPPEAEFLLRREIRQLSHELNVHTWNVLTINLHQLLMQRLHAIDREVLASMQARETSLHRRHPERALTYLKEQIGPLIEGETGLAADVIREISAFTTTNDLDADRTIIFIGRAGALYPFFRSSALLKHIDGKTANLPVVLLYPGSRTEGSGLSFMDELAPDRDYRPRIYSI